MIESLRTDGANLTFPPWIEITTVFPCSVRCYYCPQDVLISAYKGDAVLTCDNFMKALGNIPRSVIVNFAGFAEPFLNPECADMIIHAHFAGYRVAVNSTLVGLDDIDAERIKDIPFTCFWYHDTGREMKRFSFLTEIVRIPMPSSRAGNLYREQRREGSGVCQRSAEHKVNVMLPNGDVVLCCNDYGLRHKLGNLFETNYDELKRESDYELCHFCPDLEIGGAE